MKMGRTPCCDQKGLRKGTWTAEEDQILFSYIKQHGEGGWRSLPQKAGLSRCGKSCRLRWANYLRPGIRRGEFSPEEELTIIRLHATLGNRWSAIARQLYRRTDNEVKNYWNTRLRGRADDILMSSKDCPILDDKIHNNNSDNNIPITTNPLNMASNSENYSTIINSDTLSRSTSTTTTSHNVTRVALSTSSGELNNLATNPMTPSSSLNSQNCLDINSALNTVPLSKSSHINKGSINTSSSTSTSTSSASAPRALLNKIASKLNKTNVDRVIRGRGGGGSGGSSGSGGHMVCIGGRGSGGGGGGGSGGYSILESSSASNSTPSFNDNSSTYLEDLLGEVQTVCLTVCGPPGEEMCQRGVEIFDFDDPVTLEGNYNNSVEEPKAANIYYNSKEGDDNTSMSLHEQLLFTSFSMDCFEDLVKYM